MYKDNKFTNSGSEFSQQFHFDQQKFSFFLTRSLNKLCTKRNLEENFGSYTKYTKITNLQIQDQDFNNSFILINKNKITKEICSL